MVAGSHDDLPVRFLAQLTIVFIPLWVEEDSPLTASGSSTGFPKVQWRALKGERKARNKTARSPEGDDGNERRAREGSDTITSFVPQKVIACDWGRGRSVDSTEMFSITLTGNSKIGVFRVIHTISQFSILERGSVTKFSYCVSGTYLKLLACVVLGISPFGSS